MNKPFNNIYCYVDESGQHTQGKSFSVAVILVNEGSAWIRLADAIAGFSRHVDEKKPYTQSLYPEMKRNGFLIQL